MKRNHVGRVGVAVVLCFVMIWSGCSTAWIGEAESIVAVLIPAASNILALVAAVQGKGISAGDLQAIQNAGAQAGADLQLIQSLIAAYEKADAGAQPGILNQIESAISAVQGNLQGVLAGLHISDGATQAKVTAVVGIVLSEVQALAAVVPVVKGGSSLSPTLAAKGAASKGHPGEVPTSRAENAREMGHPRVPLSASEFVRAYNSTLTARTGDAGLDRVTSGLQIHLHSRVERVATGGMLK